MENATNFEMYVAKNYSDSPQYFRKEFREAINNRKVVIGMWPTEALLAGGGGVYKVRADGHFWPKGSDPFEVLKAQSIRPDNTEIEIVFENNFQFQSAKTCKFSVRFKNGLVVNIEKINVDKGV